MSTMWPFQHSKTVLQYATIFFIAALLFSYRLDEVPVHLNQDELGFGLNAYLIAHTADDLRGETLPLYFQHIDGFWITPIVTYLGAIPMKFLSLSEAHIRLTSVIIGLSSIALLMLLAQTVFRSSTLTLITGITAVTTPALFIHSRVLLDHLCPVLFVLLWLTCLKKFLDSKAQHFIFLATLSLGIGIHSYLGSRITMPLYFITTIVVLAPEIRKSFKVLGLALLGFAIPITASLPWFLAHPIMLTDNVNYFTSFNPSVHNARDAWETDLSNFFRMTADYGSYLSPRVLFLESDHSPVHSTHRAGVFAISLLPLIVLGIVEVIHKRKDKFAKLILFGFLSYPITPWIVAQPQRAARGLIVIPFAIMLACYGIVYLLRFRNKATYTFLSILCIASLSQFGLFLNDYFGEYRIRSYHVFNRNIGGAIETAIKKSSAYPTEKIYFDRGISYIDIFIKFYQIKLDQKIEHPQQLFDPALISPSQLTPKSMLVVSTDQAASLQSRLNNLEKIATISEPDSSISFVILYYRNQ